MAEALAPPLPDDIDRLAQDVLREACERRLMLATAESCTGGLLASLLTDIPGASHAFERGFVTYTDEAKHELLGVPMAILNTDGAVSEAAAVAMAEGAIRRSKADLAVSITGFTEDAPGQPGGLVHFACARRGAGGARHHVQRFTPAGRAEVRLGALRVALALLRDALLELDRAA
ncbi:MAG: CinA family protein [Phenylobacterium sp.]|uniref:CinA family protein n=1 Tax=Phenylobacterium sp. TaxID=1871053 RepID=UPI001A5128C8|nr:nicotinamide-nucleotide amidohydrolase family protein [Phenylobacterium sp.]MBL8556130.1 CinA family protein [Phenylobacterium sp.]